MIFNKILGIIVCWVTILTACILTSISLAYWEVVPADLPLKLTSMTLGGLAVGGICLLIALLLMPMEDWDDA